ncbi:MAG: hypothetical protein GXP49_03040 [Deltaproteobacteria bacterium]|nr:hypothetical protein [Deltaproteobacteria bacterium]
MGKTIGLPFQVRNSCVPALENKRPPLVRGDSKGPIIVGTVHLDFDEGPVLESCLEALGPNVVTLEISGYAVRFRQTKGHVLLERLSMYRDGNSELPPGLQPLEAQVKLPYEYTSALRYTTMANACLTLLGDDRVSRRRLDLLETEAFSRKNLDKLAGLHAPGIDKAVEAEKNRASIWFAAGPLPCAGSEGLHREEAFMAERIKEFARRGLVVVHVGGWEHMAGLAGLLGIDLNRSPLS